MDNVPNQENSFVQAPVQPTPETGKKGKITLPIKVFIVGCIIGLVIAGVGVVKQISANRTNEERKKKAVESSEQAVKSANARLEAIEKEYNELKAQYEAKTSECTAINANMSDPDWYNKSTTCGHEQSDIKSKMTDLEMEDLELKNADYNAYYQKVDPMTYLIFYIIGGSVAGVGLIAAFLIYLVKGKKTY